MLMPLHVYVLFQGAVESIAMKTPRERTQLFEEISRYTYMYNFMHFGNPYEQCKAISGHLHLEGFNHVFQCVMTEKVFAVDVTYI